MTWPTDSPQRPRKGRSRTVWPVGLAVLSVLGCRQDMHDQPRYKPLARSDFFGDGRSARPRVPGTVARGQLGEDEPLHTGKVGQAFVAALPVKVDAALMRRGQERYRIFCAPCHGQTGDGSGMIVRRGFRQPASLHVERLRSQPAGYYFDVISNGFGAMPDYAAQVTVRDRWAIIAYIRALQLSQGASLAEVPAEKRAELEEGRP